LAVNPLTILLKSVILIIVLSNVLFILKVYFKRRKKMKEEEKNLSLKRETAGCLEVERQVVELADIFRYSPRYLQKVMNNFDLSDKEIQKLCEIRDGFLEEFSDVEGIEEICSLSSLARGFVKLYRDPGRFEEFVDAIVYHLRKELVRICIQAEDKFADEEKIKRFIKRRFSTAAQKVLMDIATAEEFYFYKEWEQAAAEADVAAEEEGEEELWIIEWGRKKKKKRKANESV
jgi:hypothetical protein